MKDDLTGRILFQLIDGQGFWFSYSYENLRQETILKLQVFYTVSISLSLDKQLRKLQVISTSTEAYSEGGKKGTIPPPHFVFQP